MASAAQTRFARCSMVVMNVFPMIMQDLMRDAKVQAKDVYQRIMKTKKLKDRLTSEEMTAIQTLDSSNEFTGLDVSLIYKIAKYMKTYIPTPSRNWGSNPQENEIEVGDDVERMRIARNAMFHSVKAEITEEELESFFERFIAVGRRMDEYLDKPARCHGYEDTINNYRKIDLDADMAEHYIQALREIESLKEKIAINVTGKEIHIMAGNSMEAVIKKIQKVDANATTAVKFIIEVSDPEQKVELLNRLGAASLNTNNITFEGAYVGSIVVYVLMKNHILLKKDLLYSEVSYFMKQLFGKVNIDKDSPDDVFVVMTSAEDDIEPYSTPNETSDSSKSRDMWSGNTSIVLNLNVKDSVFQTQEALQQSMREFFGNLLSSTNGKGLLHEKDVHAVLQPGETECVMDEKEELLSLSSNDSSFGTIYSDLEYAKAQSPTSDHTYPDDLSKAQCPLPSTSTDVPNVPPKYQSLYRKHSDNPMKNPWKYYFGFRRLLEIKEKESCDIVQTFESRKMYLIDALNDPENCANTDIVVFLLRCFAKCCEIDNFAFTKDVFDIVQHSIFLKEIVVNFINEIGIRSFVQKKNYYQKSMKDLFIILLRLDPSKTDAVFESCVRPVIIAVGQKRSSFSDILDENTWKAVEIFEKMYGTKNKQLTVDTIPENPSLKSSKKQERKYVDRHSTGSKRDSKTPEKWQQMYGYKNLMKLKEADDEEVLGIFQRNKALLKDALNDENLVHDMELIGLFLRCIAKCCKCSHIGTHKPVFETVVESNFFKSGIVSFMNNAAMSPSTKTQVSLKQSIEDIFCIVDTLHVLMPSAVAAIHNVLMEMNTSINVLRSEDQLIDVEMWENYHKLFSKTHPH